MITILSDNWMNLQWDNTHRRRSLFLIVTSYRFRLWRHICWRNCPFVALDSIYMYASGPLKNRAWGAALSFCSDLTLSQEFQPMAAQLSIKAALPLAKIQVRQLYVIVVRQGPAWLVCVMSNATRLGGTVSGGTLEVRALAHGIAAPGFMPPAPAQSPPPPPHPPPTSFPIFSGKPPP